MCHDTMRSILDALKAPSVSSCNSIGDPERLLDGTRGRHLV